MTLAGQVCALLAALVADLDFSAADPGAVYDRVHPERTPGYVRTQDVYGRRLGDALAVNPRLLYPEYALGRDGSVSAVRTGNARAAVPGSAPDPVVLPESCALKPGAPSTQILWFNVDEPGALAASVRLAGCQFGYAVGFRLEWVRAHWMPKGGVSFVYGDGKTSKFIGSLGKKDVPPGVWHQAATVNDGAAFALYLDGERLGTSPGAYRLDPKRPMRVRLAEASDKAAFKVDAYRLHDCALTAEEIAADWAAGRPQPGWDGDAAAALAALPRLRANSRGFFCAGERIDVMSGGRLLKRVVYDRPGTEELVVAGRRFPLAILPGPPQATTIGAVDLLGRQSELLALGLRRTLVTVDWARVEPTPNGYDWTELDRMDVACTAQGVRAVYLIDGEPAWYAQDRAGGRAQAEKFRRLVAARFDAEIVGAADVGLIDMDVGPGQVKRQVDALLRAGKRRLFVKPRAPGWNGRYSPAYAGRPGASVIELAGLLANPPAAIRIPASAPDARR